MAARLSCRSPSAGIGSAAIDAIKHWDGPPLDAWRAWHPREAAALLAGVDAPWCVVGGWAIDLWLGRQTREHDDLEVAVPRPFFPAVRARLSGFALHVVGDGEVRALATDAEPPPERHQTWVLDLAANAWRMDVMREPGDRDTWVFRRDESIRAPRARLVGTRDGVPHLSAIGALLYKAKAMRAKDDADFANCLPHLGAADRHWLVDALQRAHPRHPWIAPLQDR